MKILYALQGTGNGHITRAIELVPQFQRYGEVDVLISGTESDLELPFPVKYRFHGLSFVFGRKGGIDYWKTYWKMKSFNLLQEINRLKIGQYDLIVSDFEPVSSWAALKAGKECVGLSNQIASLHPKSHKPARYNFVGRMILSRYAPCSIAYGIYYHSLDSMIFTPIIRKSIRELESVDGNYYTVYLPSLSDQEIARHLQKFPNENWVVYSKHGKSEWSEGTMQFIPINSNNFIQSMAGSKGVLCNAGFGTTSEALFLRKKLLVIPMSGQYEQQCNAEVLSSMGVQVMKRLHRKYYFQLANWIKTGNRVEVDYADNSEHIAGLIVTRHASWKESRMGRKNSTSIFGIL